MRFHVIGLPHTQTTREFDHCAYTAKVRKFCDMMKLHGHDVFLYASEDNEADCDELITCITKHEQEICFSRFDWWESKAVYCLDWNMQLPFWRLFAIKVQVELESRIAPHDIICMITGMGSILEAFPNHLVCEFGVGYMGIVSKYRVFESYAWMHSVYAGRPEFMDGNFYDAVIPNFYQVDEFPLAEDHGEYLLYMSRMTPLKGYELANDIAMRTGRDLVIAGVGGDTPPKTAEFVGLVDTEMRGQLLSKAHAVLVPTRYVEPFGGVAAEALLCGTPVITTDWGAFPEYVGPKDGFRCRLMRDFTAAVDAVDTLDRHEIQTRARKRFGYENIGSQYEAYFTRLLTMFDGGFYAS